MTTRRSLSTMQRLRVFEAAGGVCHLCDLKIFGKEWDVEHVRSLALGGADDETNMRPAHRDCHKVKTKADNASWTKAKRVKAKHVGAYRRSGPPMLGSKDSKWKAKIGGGRELRR